MDFNQIKREKPDLYRHLEEAAKNLLYIRQDQSLDDLDLNNKWVKSWLELEVITFQGGGKGRPLKAHGTILNKGSNSMTTESVAAQIAAAANRIRGHETKTAAVTVKGLSAEQALVAEQIATAANKRRGNHHGHSMKTMASFSAR